LANRIATMLGNVGIWID